MRNSYFRIWSYPHIVFKVKNSCLSWNGELLYAVVNPGFEKKKNVGGGGGGGRWRVGRTINKISNINVMGLVGSFTEKKLNF